jgi:hypothetical protein
MHSDSTGHYPVPEEYADYHKGGGGDVGVVGVGVGSKVKLRRKATVDGMGVC